MNREMWRECVVLAALLGLTILAGWLRLPLVGQGVTPDELASIPHASAWQMLTSAESGVNPPLLRLLFNVMLEEPEALMAGRVFSWLAGVLVVPLAFVITRWASGGSPWAALGVAGAIALHPYSVRMSGRMRGYSPWALTMMLQLGALWVWRQAEDAQQAVRSARARRAVIATAILLPWWHYQSVPLMLFMGACFAADRRWRPVIGMWVPAAVCILPMAFFVLTKSGNRVAHRGSAVELLVDLVSLQVPLTNQLASAVTGGNFPPRHAFVYFAACFALCWLVGLWQLSRGQLRDIQRVLWYGWTGMIVGAMTLSQFQLVRSPISVMTTLFCLPLVGSLLASRGWMSGLLCLLLLPPYVDGTTYRLADLRAGGDADVIRTFASDYARYAPQTIHTWPRYTNIALYFYLEGHHVGHLSEQNRRQRYQYAFTHGGRTFMSHSDWAPGAHGPGLYVALDEPPEAASRDCVLLTRERQLHVWQCPGEDGLAE